MNRQDGWANLQGGTAGVLLPEDASAGSPALLDVFGVPRPKEINVLTLVRRPTLHESQEVVLRLGRGLGGSWLRGRSLWQEEEIIKMEKSA